MSRLVALFDATPAERALLEDAGWGELQVAPRGGAGSVADAEVAVVHSFKDLQKGTWEEASRLRWIVSLPAGADHVPLDDLPGAATVLSTHGANADALAEHALALLLAGAKRIVRDTADLRAGLFAQSDRTSRRLAGATLLVVGAGTIATEVLRRARAFGLRTLVLRRSDEPHPEADETLRRAEDAWARADFVVLALPLTKETRGIVDARALAAMKRDAVLVNIARGKLVDRDALEAHLRANPDFVYATDVWWRYPPGEETAFDEPLVRLPNVLGTPHAGALVPGWRENMVAAAARALREIARTGEARWPARVERPGRAG